MYPRFAEAAVFTSASWAADFNLATISGRPAARPVMLVVGNANAAAQTLELLDVNSKASTFSIPPGGLSHPLVVGGTFQHIGDVTHTDIIVTVCWPGGYPSN